MNRLRHAFRALLSSVTPILLVTALVTLGGLGGCNTADGVGEDLGELGDAIEDAAD